MSPPSSVSAPLLPQPSPPHGFLPTIPPSSQKTALLLPSLQPHRLLSFVNRPNVLLAVSLALNLAWLALWSSSAVFTAAPHAPALGWTRAAATAAEAAASYDCSGHGELYIDTLRSGSDEEAVCECYECFTGPRCAEAIADCDGNADSGDPLFLQPYWKLNAEASALVIPGWYRMSYELVEGSGILGLLPALEKEIRLLHRLVGNAVTDGRYILVGTGSMQLLNGAVTSLSPETGNSVANVVSAVPYYAAYRTQTEMFQTSHFQWAGDARLYSQLYGHSNASSIEFVTSPNNPDGTARDAVLNGSKASTIFDRAYYWPHFTAITEPSDHDVMLFTLSKVTGHAGSRLGWAIVKDHSIYQRLLNYIFLNTIGVSHESQMRATQLLKSINRAYSKFLSSRKSVTDLSSTWYAKEHLIFHYAYAKLRHRWEKLNEVLQGSKRFSLQHLEPQYCHFFKQTSQPSPAYAWIRCERKDEKDCSAVFLKAGIIGRGGSEYGDNSRYIRLSLLKRDSSFEILVDHLRALVADSLSCFPHQICQ